MCMRRGFLVQLQAACMCSCFLACRGVSRIETCIMCRWHEQQFTCLFCMTRFWFVALADRAVAKAVSFSDVAVVVCLLLSLFLLHPAEGHVSLLQAGCTTAAAGSLWQGLATVPL
jgi:hypothetical protein